MLRIHFDDNQETVTLLREWAARLVDGVKTHHGPPFDPEHVFNTLFFSLSTGLTRKVITRLNEDARLGFFAYLFALEPYT